MTSNTTKNELKEVEVLVKIAIGNSDRLSLLLKAEQAMREAGIKFDIGCGCGYRDWEFDWSLSGAKVLFKKFSDDKLPSGKPINKEEK